MVFLSSLSKFYVILVSNIITSVFHRLSPLTTPPVEKSTMMNLSLQEIVIVGNCNDQVSW